MAIKYVRSYNVQPSFDYPVGAFVGQLPLEQVAAESAFVEKRSYSRREAVGHVICRMKSGGVETMVHAKPVNLSQNGVLIDLPAEVFAGMEVELEFLSHTGRTAFVVSGKIRTIAPKELGRWQAGCAFSIPIPAEQVTSFTR